MMSFTEGAVVLTMDAMTGLMTATDEMTGTMIVVTLGETDAITTARIGELRRLGH
jgi:hypothetical protein